MREKLQNPRSEAGGGCEGARKTAILMAIGLLVLFFATAQVQAGGGAGSGAKLTTNLDCSSAGSGFEYAFLDGGGAGSGLDGGGAGSGLDGGGAGSGLDGGGAGSG